ncbi:MAG: Crp/Fnr family transcriptional regulator [Acidobacteriaceae bacterium]
MDSLELISLELRRELYSPNLPIRHVYFPVDGVVSMLAELEEGLMVEVATVGNEGMIGLPLFLGTNTTPGTSFSQVPGKAYRLTAEEFTRNIQQPSSFTRVLHRYTQALMTQISQGTGCNRIHNNKQRCARWLLLTHDRVGKNEFQLTQEFLSQMLGVRRATVNEIAGQLSRAGAISYSRGTIHIVDRLRLEAESCLCYSIIRDEYDRMYSDFQTG